MNATLKCLEAELSGSLMGLMPDETAVRPHHRAEKWCVQQIVSHLLLTYRSTVEGFEGRIAKGRPTLARPDLMQRVMKFYVLRLERFPEGRMAPEMVMPGHPAEDVSGEGLIELVQVELGRLDEVAGRADAIFGAAPSVSHHVLGPMAVDEWRIFHLVHGRHHIGQIMGLRKELGRRTARVFSESLARTNPE